MRLIVEKMKEWQLFQLKNDSRLWITDSNFENNSGLLMHTADETNILHKDTGIAAAITAHDSILSIGDESTFFEHTKISNSTLIIV